MRCAKAIPEGVNPKGSTGVLDQSMLAKAHT